MWAKHGATYDTNNTFHPPLCEQLVVLAGIHPGAAVLDVATGTGKWDVPPAADTARARMQCPVTLMEMGGAFVLTELDTASNR